MKKLIIILIIALSLVFAEDLPAYVAKFDPHLAIELYQEKLSGGEKGKDIYTALAHLYRETGQIGLAEASYRHLISIRDDREGAYRDYLQFLCETTSYKKLRGIIDKQGFDSPWSDLLMARSYFMQADFDSSLIYSQQLIEQSGRDLAALSLEGLLIRYRSPFLGGVMSAVLPGSGKVYAGRLFDGLQAFSVVAAPAYNAYYHFNKTGPKSVQAWIWTAVSAWFYLSDIYGSVKAVNEYNEMQEMKIIERFQP